MIINFDGIKILLSHYAYPDFSGSLTAEVKKKDDLLRHFDFMKKNGVRLSISGHDHTEGFKIITSKEEKITSFGKFNIDQDQPLWISIPCVTNGVFANGVAVLDTEKLMIEAVPLCSKKHEIPDWKNV